MNYNRIEELTKTLSIDMQTFCDAISMSKAGYYKMLKDQTLKVEVLERIANYFSVPVSTFFDEPEPEKPINYQRKYIESLEENKELQKENIKLREQINVLEKNTSISKDVPVRKLDNG